MGIASYLTNQLTVFHFLFVLSCAMQSLEIGSSHTVQFTAIQCCSTLLTSLLDGKRRFE